MNGARNRLAALALIATVTVVSACGSSGGAGSTAGTQKGAKFAQCMRTNGVSQFPDPNSSGGFTLDSIANGSGIDVNAPAFEQALKACQSLEPAGFTGTPRSSQQQQAALGFAACMRRNGVSDFPDPVEGQPLVDTNRIPSSNSPGGMSALRAAMRACASEAAAAGAGR
jgi:hypothetical protein